MTAPKKKKPPKYKMPERLPEDGAVTVSRLGEKFLTLRVETDGKEELITLSLFNAWRLFGSLSLMLNLPLNKEVSAAIQMTASKEHPITLTFGLEPYKKLSFGDRVAHHLKMDIVLEELQKQGHNVQRVRQCHTCGVELEDDNKTSHCPVCKGPR